MKYFAFLLICCSLATHAAQLETLPIASRAVFEQMAQLHASQTRGSCALTLREKFIQRDSQENMEDVIRQVIYKFNTYENWSRPIGKVKVSAKDLFLEANLDEAVKKSFYSKKMNAPQVEEFQAILKSMDEANVTMYLGHHTGDFSSSEFLALVDSAHSEIVLFQSGYCE
jgi:hypothetical protein